MEGTDFAAIAAGIPDMGAGDIGAGRRVGWRGAFTVENVDFEYAMFERPDGSFTGYGLQEGETDGVDIRTVHGFRVIPEVEEEKADVPRIGQEAPRPVVPPEAARDAVAEQLAAEFGTTAEAIRPYVETSLGPDMTRGDGDAFRSVEVTVWLDENGRPLEAGGRSADPCDPGYGEASAAKTRLRYRFRAFGETIVAQGARQYVETGRIESAFMEDLGDASGDLGTAAERAHEGLAPDLSAPRSAP